MEELIAVIENDRAKKLGQRNAMSAAALEVKRRIQIRASAMACLEPED